MEPTHAEAITTDVDGTGVPASDLRKKLLETAHETGLASRAPSSPAEQATPSDDVKVSTTDDEWIREAVTNQPSKNSANRIPNPKRMPFFANTTYYTLLRLLQVIQSIYSFAQSLIMTETDSLFAVTTV
jgi:paired amphipathic helix protein Sin3a